MKLLQHQQKQVQKIKQQKKLHQIKKIQKHQQQRKPHQVEITNTVSSDENLNLQGSEKSENNKIEALNSNYDLNSSSSSSSE
ncbi:hypothetical protein BUZ50_11565 [Staphylococcus hominis]|nr:hypothetical protein BUZ50_11565 [Staphylococcus hominis]